MLRFKHTKIFSMFFLIEFLSIILILKTIFPNNNYNECLSARNKRLLSILKILVCLNLNIIIFVFQDII